MNTTRTIFSGASAIAVSAALAAASASAQTAPTVQADPAASAPGEAQSAQPGVQAGVPATAGGQPATAGDASGTTAGGDVSEGAEGSAIVVTGLRQSLASAEAIKRNSEQIVDSITSQDIGRLPDTNVAEALQRISGIQIQRDRGEGSTIAIRGLNEVRTELNGEDIFSANGSHGISFEELGPDLLSGIDVYKNPSAELIEGSLGGTVNLRTRMPFDAPGRVISFTGSATRYDFADKNRFGGSALFSDRWQTGIGQLGFLANASWQQTAFREDKVQIEPYYLHGPDAVAGAQVENTLVPGYETQDIEVPSGGGFNDAVGNRKRFSASAAVQWKPADNLEFYGQFLTAHYRYHDYGLSFFLNGDPLTPTPGSTYTVTDGVATSGELENPSGSDVVYQNNQKTLTNDYTAGAKWAITSRLHASIDYQHIYSDEYNPSVNLTLGVLNPAQSIAGLGQNYNLEFDTRGKVPSLLVDVPGYLNDPSSYYFQAIQPSLTSNRATANAVRGDLDWDFDDGSFLRKISVGARYSAKNAVNRSSSTWSTVGGTCANWASPATCYTANEFPDFIENNPLQSSLLRGRAADLYFGPVLQWRLADAADPSKAFADVNTISGQTIGFTPFNDPNNAQMSTVDEKDTAAYVRVAFGSSIFGMAWDGNAGVRYVRTSEDGQGLRSLSYRDPNSVITTNPDGSTTGPTTITTQDPFGGGRVYTKWLPSLNLRLHVTSKLQARFALSKNIYRPDFNQINPSYTLSPTYDGNGLLPRTVDPNQPYNATTNPYLGSGNIYGNPNLKPERVTSFDGSLEWYFSSTGYVFVDLFKKNLKDLLDTRPQLETEEVPGLGNVQFNVNSIVNVTKGGVKGFEIGGQRFFDFLPGELSGLGVQANFTLAQSNAGVLAEGGAGSTSTVAVPLIDLSKYSYNLIALYDKYGINLRLAYNWRSKYLLTTQGVGTATLPEFVKPYGVLDASASYDINKNLSVTIDAANLNDAAYHSYLGKKSNPRDFQLDDRRISARIRLRI